MQSPHLLRLIYKYILSGRNEEIANLKKFHHDFKLAESSQPTTPTTPSVVGPSISSVSATSTPLSSQQQQQQPQQTLNNSSSSNSDSVDVHTDESGGYLDI